MGKNKQDDEPRIDWTEKQLEERLNLSFLLGQVAGWEDAGKKFVAESGDAFAKSDDTKAKLLRSLGNELIEISKKRRAEYDAVKKQHEKDFPKD